MRHVNVLLAGGASRRFGEPKAFVNWRNKMFYEWAKTALGDKKPVIKHTGKKTCFRMWSRFKA
jgi:molybdopterin-guanine dinucleotide biosynthesis protein A